jgi:hypothetical protein
MNRRFLDGPNRDAPTLANFYLFRFFHTTNHDDYRRIHVGQAEIPGNRGIARSLVGIR